VFDPESRCPLGFLHGDPGVALGIERWGRNGHSFGSIVAAEYIRQHSERVVGVVFVDMSPEGGAC
jgi:pimeloyl-ACP methyl ester carboxylesterase